MKTKQGSLEIVIDRQRSIEELAGLAQDGTSVLRTCHAGNLSAHNMALLDSGIPAWLVDYARVGNDSNYQPENVIRDGKVTRLTDASGKTTKDVILEDGIGLDEFHADSMRLAFTGSRIETASSYLERHADIAREIIDITGDESDYAELDSLRVGTNKMLLITFIAEALESQRSHQFHLGGTYLHKYIGKIASSLGGAVDLVRRDSTFGTDIPEDITISIVPAEHAVFATSADKKPQLDDIVDALVDFFDTNEQLVGSRRRFFSEERTREERVGFLSQAEDRQNRTHHELQATIAELGEVIDDRSTGVWTTQYDVLDSGGLYSHPINRSLTMDRLQTFHGAVLKARQHISSR